MRPSFMQYYQSEGLDILYKSGLRNVFLGIESFNEDDLKLYNKGLTVNDNINAIELLKKRGINIDIGFISINPYSSIERLRLNAFYLNKYKFASIDHYTSSLMVFKGTQIYKKIENDGLLFDSKDIFDVYNYNFVNNNIKLLKESLIEFSLQNPRILDESEYYSHFYTNLLNYYYLLYEIYDNSFMMKNIKDHLKTIIDVLVLFSDLAYEWYMEILEMHEHYKDRETVEKTNKAYSFQMIELLNKLNIEKFRFSKQMVKYNKSINFDLLT